MFAAYNSEKRYVEKTMSTKLSPIVSEFETVEQEASYVEWLKAKVKASLDDLRPSIPHDQVMSEMRDLIESKLKNAS
jgi:hypothetical protein